MFWVPPSRTEQCWLNIIEGIAPAVNWKTKFRMLKSWFDYLQTQFLEIGVPYEAKKIAITLHYLKTPGL